MESAPAHTGATAVDAFAEPAPAHGVSVPHVVFMGSVHAGALAAFAWPSWAGLATMLFLYAATGLGITVGYHRLLAHRAYRTPRWMARVLATLGVLAMQGGPMRWVADHRQHHFHSDADGDPHDIARGLFYAHMGWLFLVYPPEYDRRRIEHLARDIGRDPYLHALERFHFLPGIALGALLLAIGGLPLFLWGFCLRLVVLYHSTWLVNSACHTRGNRPFEHAPGTNNWLVALLAFGEGWHNNHHAWPASARHGLGPRQLDVSWLVISGLHKLGLARDVIVARPDADAPRGISATRG